MNGIHVIARMRVVSKCVVCGRVIPWERGRQNVCSERCKKARYERVRRERREKRK